MKPKKISIKTLLKNAQKPAKIASKLHTWYRGKIEITPKCKVSSIADFSVWYTPGVAKVCTEIQQHPELVYEYTNKWNSVAVVSDGSRVLGLGDIGPEAGLPVMEGKAVLFKTFGGVDSFPIAIDSKDPDEIVNIVKKISSIFGIIMMII